MADSKIGPNGSNASISIVNRSKGGYSERRGARDGDVGRLRRGRRRDSGKHCAEQYVFYFHVVVDVGLTFGWIVIFCVLILLLRL